jgi:hypothetical protein
MCGLSQTTVGSEADGAAGNSDVDLATAPEGTLYFIVMSCDRQVSEGEASRSHRVGMEERAGPGDRSRDIVSTIDPGSKAVGIPLSWHIVAAWRVVAALPRRQRMPWRPFVASAISWTRLDRSSLMACSISTAARMSFPVRLQSTIKGEGAGSGKPGRVMRRSCGVPPQLPLA